MENNSLGQFLAGKRQEKGLTQAQLAKRMRVSSGAVARWETDDLNIPRDRAEQLSEQLEIKKEKVVLWAFAETYKSGLDDLRHEYVAYPRIQQMLEIFERTIDMTLEPNLK